MHPQGHPSDGKSEKNGAGNGVLEEKVGWRKARLTDGDGLNQPVESFCVCRVAPPRERTCHHVKNKGSRYSSSNQEPKAFGFHKGFAKEENEKVGKAGGEHERLQQGGSIRWVEKQIGNKDCADGGDP